MSRNLSRPDPTDNPTATERDTVIVAGAAPGSIDALRLATVRSDDVILIAPIIAAKIQAFCRLFAIEMRERAVTADDLDGASALIVVVTDRDTENGLVRMARRRHVPVHVTDRPLVSDFTLLDLVERRSLTLLAA